MGLGGLGDLGAGGVKIGTLYAELKLSKESFDKAATSSGSMFSGLKTVAMGAGVAIAGALVGVGIAAIDAAKDNEVAGARLQAVLQANVKGWDGNTAAIDAANAAGVRKGFNDDELTNALSGLVTRTHDVAGATDLLSQAEDLARLKGIDVGTAANIIGKVYDGNTGILSRYGIAVDKGATSEEALASISKAAAGQSEAYAKTSAGQWDTFNSSLQVVLAAIGTALLPLLSALANIATAVLLPAITFIGNILTTILSPILGTTGEKAGEAGDAFSGVAGVISDVFGPAIDLITGTILPALRNAFGWFTDTILPALGAAFDWVSKNVLPILMAAIKVLVQVYVALLKAELDFLINVVLPALGAAFDWIVKNVLPPVFAVFNWLAKNVLPAVMAAIDVVVNVVLPALGRAFGVAVDTIGRVLGVLGSVVKGAIDFIWPIISKVADVLFPLLSKAGEIMGKAIGAVFDGIKNGIGLARDVISNVVDAIGKAWSGLKGLFQTVGDAITGAVRSAMNALIGIVNGVITAVDSVQVHIGRIGLDTPAGFVGVGPFDWNGVNIPKLGYLARGTDWWRGGLAMLGEQGPELAMLPRGSQVLDAGDTRRLRDLVRGGMGGGAMIAQQNVYGMQPGDVERETTRALRRVALDWNVSAR